MNMISTGAFHIEMDASDKQKNSLVKKLVSAWEQKNSKTARAGGVSLMALSLAACGSSDDDAAVSYTQAQLDAAKAAATSAATSAAEATAATATAAAAAAAATAQATAVAEAEATAAATAAAAKVTSDAALATLQSSYDAIVAPKTLTLAKTTAEILNGGPGADTFTGPSAFYADTDQIIDAVTGDGDIYNLSITGAATPSITNVETVNVTVNSIAALTLTASSMTGVDVMNVTMGNVVVGGSPITGTKIITIAAMDAADVGKVVAGAGTITVDITQATTAGAVVDADNASGSTTVVGATTVTAMGAGTGDTVTVQALNVVAQDAKPVSITTSAATVAVTANTANFTGTIDITATNATTVDVASGTGGMTITAAGNQGTSGTNGIDIHGVDASGATITTSYVGSTTSGAEGEIQITGTAATTDVATISANGATNIDNDTTAVDILNLSGNTTDATYYIVDIAASTYAGSGSHAVNLSGNVSKFSATTVSGVNTLTLSAGTAADIDFDSVDATTVSLGYDNEGAFSGTELSFTVKSGANFEVTVDQTDMVVDFATGATANDFTLVAGDVNGALNSAVGTLSLTDFNVDGALAGTITLEASKANLTNNSTVLGAKHNLVITGDEDVTLGTVTAKSLDASNSTGIITATSTTSALTLTTGSGADVLTVNGNAKHTVVTNGGNDSIDLNDTKDASSFSMGDGNDTMTIDAAGGIESIVVTLGAGDDTFTTDQDVDAIIVAGDGTDTLDLDGTNVDYSDNANFSFTGFEAMNLVGTATDTTISAAQLAGNSTIALTGTADVLSVTVKTAGGTLDASGVTIASGSTVTLDYTGSTGTDTITGSANAENAYYTRGSDTIDLGTGTDFFVMADTTLDATALGLAGSATSTGAVFNLGSTSVSGTTVYAAVTGYTGSNADVASNSVSHIYAANATTNSTESVTLAGVENITGGDGADYIQGSGGVNALRGAAGADHIIGGDGADYILGGAGIDVVYGGNGIDSFAIHSSLTANRTTIMDWASTDKILFGADDNSGDSDLFDLGQTILPDTDASSLTVAAAGNGGSVVVPALDYIEGSLTMTVTAEHVNVCTDATGAAGVTGIMNAIDDDGTGDVADDQDCIIVFYNTTTSKVEMWSVAEAGTAANNFTDETATQLATFDNVAAADIAASFANTNFEVELIA